MSFPGSTTLLPQIVEALDGTHTDVYHIANNTYSGTVVAYGHRLGTAKGGSDTTTIAPVLPTGHQVIAAGAYPIASPGAPTSVGVVSDTAYGLTQNGDYKWALGNVTAYGDTVPGTVYHNSNIGGAGATCGYTLTLPSASQGTTDAPILFRRLYRTKTTGSQLYYVRDVPLLETTVTDTAGDDALVQTAPSSNTSGLTGNVTVTGTNGATSNVWTERAPGATLAAGDFIVDYGLGLSGGTVTFASADSGLVPTITYTAATLLNSPLLAAAILAIRDLKDVLIGVQSATGLTVNGILAGLGDVFVGRSSALNPVAGLLLQVDGNLTVRGAAGSNNWANQRILWGGDATGYVLHLASINNSNTINPDAMTVADNGNVAIAGTLGVAGNTTVTGNLTGGNFVASGTGTPTVARPGSGSNANIAATGSIFVGNDCAGQASIDISGPVTIAAGTHVMTFTLAHARTWTPAVSIGNAFFADNDGTITPLAAWVFSATTTTIVLDSVGAFPVSAGGGTLYIHYTIL